MALGHWAVEYLGEGNGQGGFAPDITNPQDGDTLVYNATAGKWVNGAGGSGGGGLVVHDSVDEATGKKTLDKTWQEIHDAIVSGVFVIVPHSVTDTKAYIGMVMLVDYDEEYGYGVYTGGESNIAYYTPTTNGYPSSGGGSHI